MRQQEGGFIMKYYFGNQILPDTGRKVFLYAHWQTIDVQLCFTVPRYAFLIGFTIPISKPEKLRLNLI